MSEKITAILSQMQKGLKAKKGQYNSFGKYHYRSLEDLTEAIKPLLPSGVALIMSDELVMIGNRYYIKATAKITDGKESQEATGWAREAEDKKGMDDSQITGSTSSYARKYACNALFAVDDCKDADATNDHGKGHQEPEKPRSSVPTKEAAPAKEELPVAKLPKKTEWKTGTVLKKWEDDRGLWIRFKTPIGEADVKCDPDSYDFCKEGEEVSLTIGKNDNKQLYVTDFAPF